jgi:hypothetical protein
VQLFLLIAIGKFASSPHDLVTTGSVAPSPATGINNQTLPCEILDGLFDCSIASSSTSSSGQPLNSNLVLIAACLLFQVFRRCRATRIGTTDVPSLDIRRLAPQVYNDQRIVGLAPPFARSDRVDGSGGALCLTALRGAYRRVAQSRICTTVYSPAQRSQWGLIEAASARK